MNWNEFAAEVHQVAVDHGWWEKAPTFTEVIVMCHSELSEALEEYRMGGMSLYHKCAKTRGVPCVLGNGDPCEFALGDPCVAMVNKPEGMTVELADCILRILDWFAAAKVDIDAIIGFSPSSDDVIETIALCHSLIAQAQGQTTVMFGTMDVAHSRLLMCIETIMDWAGNNDVDMEAILRTKHEYNKARPYKHGGNLL